MLGRREVYLLYNTVTKKGYVGSSGNVSLRIKSHLSNLRCGHHPVEEMQSDFDEYGEHFVSFILDTASDYSEWHKERDWIRKLKTFDKRYGYNYKDNLIVPGRPSKRTKHFYEYQGKKITAGELSLIANVPYRTLQSRLLAGWNVERAVNEPLNPPGSWSTKNKAVNHG